MNLGSIDTGEADEAVEQNDLIKPPVDGELKNTPEDITVIVNNEDGDKPAVLTEETLDRLVNANLTFKNIADKSERTAVIQQVEQGVAALESISRLQGDELQAQFGEMFTNQVKINRFTDIPSKTNLRESQAFMKQALESHIEEVSEMVKSYFITSNAVLLKDLEGLKAVLTGLADSMNVFFYVQKELFDRRIKENPNMVVPVGDEFLNLAKVDLATFDPTLLPASTPNRVSVVQAAEAIKEVSKIGILGAFISMIIDSDDLDSIYELHRQEKGVHLSYNDIDLFLFFTKSRLENLTILIDEQQKLYNELSEFQQKAMEALDANSGTTADRFWSDNQAQLQTVMKKATDQITLAFNLQNLFANFTTWHKYLLTIG